MASRDIARRQVLAPACLSSTELKHAQCSMNVRETPLDKYHMPMSVGTTSKERKESAHLRYRLCLLKKSLPHENGLRFRDRKCLPVSRQSLISHPDAMRFS